MDVAGDLEYQPLLKGCQAFEGEQSHSTQTYEVPCANLTGCEPRGPWTSLYGRRDVERELRHANPLKFLCSVARGRFFVLPWQVPCAVAVNRDSGRCRGRCRPSHSRRRPGTAARAVNHARSRSSRSCRAAAASAASVRRNARVHAAAGACRPRHRHHGILTEQSCDYSVAIDALV